MFTFPGGNGGINGGHKLNQVKRKSGNYIPDIGIVERFWPKDDGYRPPKADAVHEKQGNLRQKGLRTMPAHKKRGIPVAEVKYQGGQKVDDGEWQSTHDGDQRHQVTV